MKVGELIEALRGHNPDKEVEAFGLGVWKDSRGRLLAICGLRVEGIETENPSASHPLHLVGPSFTPEDGE